MNSSFSLPLALWNLGGTELIVILAIMLLLFGGSKLPSLARGLGQSVKEFKKATNDAESEEKPSSPANKSAAETTKSHGVN